MEERVIPPQERRLDSPFAGEGARAELPGGAAADPVLWSLRETLIGSLLTLAAFLIPTGVIFLTTLRGRAGGGSQALPQSVLSSPLLLVVIAVLVFVVAGLFEAVFDIAPLVAAFRRKRGGWRALALRPPVSWARAVTLILVFLLVTYLLTGLYILVLSQFHQTPQTNAVDLIRLFKTSPPVAWGTIAVTVLVAPFAEELFFRGYLFRGLRLKIGTIAAVLVSALVFAAIHLSPGTFVQLCILGLFLATLVARTRSLWPAILLHTLNNTVTAIIILVTVYHK